MSTTLIVRIELRSLVGDLPLRGPVVPRDIAECIKPVGEHEYAGETA
jgi:hypothetical protein